MVSKIFTQLINHKIVAGIAVLLIIGGGYFGYSKIFKSNAVIRYATAQVRKGAFIISITGSGQVSASNQIDIKPKAAGDIVYVGVKSGQEVGVGTLLAQLDARDAQKSVRDAEANLESAKISFEKLKKPADALSILQAENALVQSKESKQKAGDDLKKSYDDGFNIAANAFLDLPTIMTGLHDILFSNDFVRTQSNVDYYADAVKIYDYIFAFQYKDDANNAYQAGRQAYDKAFANYKSATRYSDSAVLAPLLDETYNTTKLIAESVKSANNLIRFYKDKLTERDVRYDVRADAALADLNTYTGKTNSHLLSLLSIKNSIQNNQDNIASVDRSIAEKIASLAKIKEGADVLDIQSAELTIRQRENALLDAKEKLSDYFVRAPFSGVVAKLDAKEGNAVSSGAILATFVTKQKIAEISLNEVDIAKIKTGQKATLTFDAILDLTITGQVVEVDAVGTVSQGVVTYAVKIGFDVQDSRVKAGMSVSSAIIIDSKPNALFVPNSAVKFQGGANYVEIVNNDDKNITLAAGLNGATLKSVPRRQPIETGGANDDFTEITRGLQEGDLVVTRTIQLGSGNAQSQIQQQSGLRIPGLTGGGGQMRTR